MRKIAGTIKCEPTDYSLVEISSGLRSVHAYTSKCLLQAKRNVGLVPSLARPVLLAANSLADKLTNVACDVVPDTVERGTVRLPQACVVSSVICNECQCTCFTSQVEVAVKAGLVLVAVSVARSLLGVRLYV